MASNPTARRWKPFCRHHHARAFRRACVKVEELFHPGDARDLQDLRRRSSAAMLIIDNVTVRIAGRVILDGASAAISDGRKVGLIGRNGAGKTTLLRLILGEHESETGKIELSKKLARRRGGAGSARPVTHSLIETVLAADTERTRTACRGWSITDDPHEAGRNPCAAGRDRRLCGARARGADSRRARLSRKPSSSGPAPNSPAAGGCAWRWRRCCFAAPDLLLLDEPTNYLDLEGALWLEDYLRRYRGTVVLVSHDRDLLNRAVDSILHLEHGKLTLYSGGYDRFRRSARTEARARCGRPRAAGGRAQTHPGFHRPFPLQGVESEPGAEPHEVAGEDEAGDAVVADENLPPIRLPQPEAVAPPLIAHRSRFGRVTTRQAGVVPCLAAHRFRRPHRAARPKRQRQIDAGQTDGGPLASRFRRDCAARANSSSAISRSISSMNWMPAKPLCDVLCAHRPLIRRDSGAHAGSAASAFPATKAETPIASLSGGERARLLLAIATLDKPNLLILDEPTNHLDIDAREELLNALNEYEGAVVLISHDRRLIEACADTLLLVADGRVRPFDGDMDDYRSLILSRRRFGRSANIRPAKPSSKAEQRREAARTPAGC